VGTLVVQGEPGSAIVSVAARLGCDLIVMSTHGLSGLKRAVLGSVADHVIRHAPDIAVLLCPNEDR
jgi:nucleotide-binding universal stress UspA family protein